jgi:hypothetical protein
MRRDRRLAALPYFDFTISGAIDQSEQVLRDPVGAAVNP